MNLSYHRGDGNVTLKPLSKQVLEPDGAAVELKVKNGKLV